MTKKNASPPERSWQTYEIWVEGFAATGEHGTAYIMGQEAGPTFKAACITFFEKNPKLSEDFDPKHLSYWACRLFDNERDARKMFG